MALSVVETLLLEQSNGDAADYAILLVHILCRWTAYFIPLNHPDFL